MSPFRIRVEWSPFPRFVRNKTTTGRAPRRSFQKTHHIFEDNLLTGEGTDTHHGDNINIDEDLTPSLENPIIFLWLHLIDPGLPQLVKQKYGTELRNKSLASLKLEISQALSYLLESIRMIDDTRALRIGNARDQKPQTYNRKTTAYK